MADDEKKNNNQEQQPNNANVVEKYSLTVSVIKDKLQLHLHDKKTKHTYHGSFSTEDLQKCGFPEQDVSKVDVVAKFLESVRKDNKQWKLTMTVEFDVGVITLVKEDDYFPLKIMMRLNKAQRKETDIINDYIKDLKIENQQLRDELKKHCVPKGSVMIWSGNANDVPSGWKLCDGNNGTPDLRNRFVMGASDTINVHTIGGSKGHKHNIRVNGHRLTIAEMPSHTHRSEHALVVNHRNPNDVRHFGKRGGGMENSYDREHEKLNKVGGNQAHSHTATSQNSNHLPPYYAMCYIMKVI